jgi:two-component system, OmpR family, KDP operon response regulator KdpE
MSPLRTKVLLVDDEPAIRRALHSSLTPLGFQVEDASGADRALSLVRRQRYDAVLLDINMPGVGGIEACRALRRLSPRLPILMLTVRDCVEDKIEALVQEQTTTSQSRSTWAN